MSSFSFRTSHCFRLSDVRVVCLLYLSALLSEPARVSGKYNKKQQHNNTCSVPQVTRHNDKKLTSYCKASKHRSKPNSQLCCRTVLPTANFTCRVPTPARLCAFPFRTHSVVLVLLTVVLVGIPVVVVIIPCPNYGGVRLPEIFCRLIVFQKMLLFP